MHVTIFAPMAVSPLVRAIRKGFEKRNDEVRIETFDRVDNYKGPNDWTQLAVFIDKKYPTIYERHNKAGRHTLLIEPGYIDPSRYWRIALDGYQSRFLHAKNHSPDRLNVILDRIGLTLKPSFHRPTSPLCSKMLYVGCSGAYCAWHRLGIPTELDSNLIRSVVSKVPDTFHILWKPTWPIDTPGVYMPRRTEFVPDNTSVESVLTLPEVKCLITHGHPSTVRAIIEAVPTVLLSSKKGINPGESIATTAPERAHRPNEPSDSERRQVLSNIAWNEFTLEEFETGIPFELIEPYHVKRIEPLRGSNPNNMAYIIAQYELMHEQGNRYRGGLADDIILEISRLVEAHKATTLLDYGSGKGRQYTEFNSQQSWGGIKPTCYDPAVPAFAAKPKGVFDGVICTDVAEHWPPEQVEHFISEVTDYADKFVVWCIFTGPARKNLPDGRNCHLTIESPEWWLNKLEKYLLKKELTREQVQENHYVLTDGELEVSVFFRSKE